MGGVGKAKAFQLATGVLASRSCSGNPPRGEGLGDRAEILQGDREAALQGCSHNMLRRWSEKFHLVKHFDKKFCLNEHVYLVKGGKRSAVYDLCTGDVCSVDETFTNTLDLALLGRTPKEITMEAHSPNVYEVLRLVMKLADQGLGDWYEGPTRSSPSYKDLPSPPWRLQFA